MTVRTLMSGYTAYTDAEELAAMRGTHLNEFVTTTGTVPTVTSTLCAVPESNEREYAAVLTIVRQAPENL